MKWREMSVFQKILFVLGWICAVAYLVLIFLDESGILTISRAWLYPLFGIYWLCMGICLNNKKLAIMHYILAAAWLLLSLLRL